jgi:hypothetical protein
MNAGRWTPTDIPGEEEATVDGVTYRRGERAVLRLGHRNDPYDRILDGRSVTLERIYLDYEDKLYFAVTIDDDPGQDLMRETGRFLFFFIGELEVSGT